MTHYCGNPLLVFVRAYGLDLHCTRCGRSWAARGGTGMMWQLQYVFEAWRLVCDGRLVHCFEGEPL